MDTEGSTPGLATAEPLEISGPHQEREARAQHLASLFIDEMIPLLVQVRQDFLDKDRAETICGVKTFTEYCTGVLRYSESHVRNLIKGQNPASDKHDGSANRKPVDPAVELPEPTVATPADEPQPISVRSTQQPVIDAEFVDAPRIAETPLTVKDVLDWKAKTITDEDGEERIDVTFITESYRKRSARPDTIAATFRGLTPAIAKKLAEYYLRLKAAAAPPDVPQPPSKPAPVPVMHHYAGKIGNARRARTRCSAPGWIGFSKAAPANTTRSRKNTTCPACIAALNSEAPQPPSGPAPDPAPFKAKSAAYLAIRATKLIKQYRECKISAEEWLAWIVQEESKVKNPNSPRGLKMRDIRTRAENEIRIREMPMPPTDDPEVPVSK